MLARIAPLVFGLAGTAFAQGLAFAELHRVLPPVERLGRLIARGDVNGDGRDDVVLLGTGTSVVWLGTPDGTFAALPGAFPTTSTTPSAVVLADVDLDADLDCVIANAPLIVNTSGPGYTGASYALFRNDGLGHFMPSPGAMPSYPTDECNSIAAGDVDGDNDADLLIGTQPQWYISTPGTIWNPPTYSSFGGENRLFRNNGQGIFSTSSFPAQQQTTRSVLLEDFDGDSDLDVFVGNANEFGYGNRQDRLYLNTGGGVYVEATLPFDGRYNLTSYASDVDGDTDIDLLVHDFEGVRLLSNNGAGVFTVGAFPLTGITVSRSMVGDWNVDGRLDFATVMSMNVNLFHNIGGTFVPATTLALPVALASNESETFVADLESDGDPDLITATTGIESFALRNDTTGTWPMTPFDVTPLLHNPWYVAIGDMDGDTHLDVVGASFHSSATNVFFRNDGTGRLVATAAGAWTANTSRANGIAAGDMDGDGDLDVVCASTYVTSQLYLNGSFTMIPLPALATCVAIGDLDGDGDRDIYFGRWYLNPVEDVVLLNQGSGTFTVQAGATPVLPGTEDVVLADVDGDGDLDAARADYVLINNGGGVFQAQPLSSLTVPTAVAAADVDGDGDIDLALGPDSQGMNALTLQLYRNNGSGSFAASAGSLPADVARTTALAFADFDGDGDQDLLQTTSWAPGYPNWSTPTRVLVNNGTGVFTVATDALPSVPSVAMHAGPGDFDGDGDIDLMIAAGGGSPRLFWNLRHQLAWRGWPRVGHLLTLDLFGRANEPFALGLALAPTNLPIPGIGTLRLDPGSLQLIATGAYDTAGRATFQAPVPNAPGLIGLSLYWQALSGTAPTLGNLEVTTLLAP